MNAKHKLRILRKVQRQLWRPTKSMTWFVVSNTGGVLRVASTLPPFNPPVQVFELDAAEVERRFAAAMPTAPEPHHKAAIARGPFVDMPAPGVGRLEVGLDFPAGSYDLKTHRES